MLREPEDDKNKKNHAAFRQLLETAFSIFSIKATYKKKKKIKATFHYQEPVQEEYFPKTTTTTTKSYMYFSVPAETTSFFYAGQFQNFSKECVIS